jgi:hypothetical protein
MDRRLAEHFINAGLVTRQDMQRFILRASMGKTTLVAQLLDAELVSQQDMAAQLAQFHQVSALDTPELTADPRALSLLTPQLAQRGGVLPYAFNAAKDQVSVVVADPEAAREVLDLLKSATGAEPRLVLAPRDWLAQAIQLFYVQHAGRGGTIRTPYARISQSMPAQPPPQVTAHTPPPSRVVAEQAVESFITDLDVAVQRSRPVTAPRISAPILEPSRPAPALVAGAGDEFGDVSSLGPGFWEQPAKRWGWNEEQGPPSGELRASHLGVAPNFDLFDDESEPLADGTINAVVERQQKQILSLKEELQRQREVIQVLAQMLTEARVISKRELKRRLQVVRQDDNNS